MALNAETTSTLSSHIPAYLEKRFLSSLRVKFHFNNFGMKAKLQKNMGKTVKWHRWTDVADSVTALTEGTVPSGVDLASTAITATAAGYGQFAATTDFLNLSAINDQMKDMVDLLGYAGGKSLDALVRNEVDQNGTAQLAKASANVAAVQADATAVLNASEIRKAAKTLRAANAEEFEDGMFKGIIHPYGEYDILSDTSANSAIQTLQHTDGGVVKKGLIGSLYGVQLYRSSHIRTSDAALADSATNVYLHCIFGKDAYGCVDLEGAGLKIITKGLGSGGTSDPLDQLATVGYKFYFATKMLQAARAIVIKAYGAA